MTAKPVTTKKNRRYSSIMLRMFAAFSALLLLTIALLYLFFTNLSKETLWEQTGQHIITVVEMSDSQLADRMNTLSQSMLSTMVNEKLYEKMELIKKEANRGYMLTSNDIRAELNVLFGNYNEVTSAQIMYNGFVITDRYRADIQNWVDGVKWSFSKSQAWEKIQNGKGSTIYLSPDEVPREDMLDPTDGGYIWMARVLNMTDLKNIRQAFREDESKPVLLLSIDPKSFYKQILENVNIPEAACYLLDARGMPFDNLDALPDTDINALSAAVSASGGSGMWSDGDELYYFTKSGFADWYYMVCMKREALSGDMMAELNGYTLLISALLLVGMLIVAALFSRSISKPVLGLVAAAQQMEKGEFGGVIPYHSRTEIGYLVDQFNKMNASIHRLIEENYQVRLREKDSEIMSLTIQFNPHFLYNTLNAIHWVALRGNAREAAHMIQDLALMMRYTSDQKQECTRLRDDMEWMKRYLYLMEARYGDLYRVEWDVDEEIMDMLVPKLFLQPLVENSITHGFKNIETGGEIHIQGRDVGDGLAFTISDNGCGMTQELIETYMQAENAPRIGLANVSRRVRLICGEGYGMSIQSVIGQGTCITVKLSKNSATE